MEKKKVKGPTLNVWRVKKSFSVEPGKKGAKKIKVKERELLFLVDIDGDYYIFKTEDDSALKIHKNIEKKGYIVKDFSL